MILDSGKTYVRRLVAPSRASDHLALQLGLTRVLSTGDLHPPSLPPSAIVCIRRLRDPLPGSLLARERESRSLRIWEQAVRASLSQISQRATRPACDAVRAQTEAILFADHAELLACLARDWCEGSIASHWWWRGLLKGTDFTAAVQRAWIETPPYVPAALHWLSEWGLAASFLRTWDNFHVKVLWSNVAQSFALRELQPSLLLALAEPETAISNRSRDDRGANTSSPRITQHAQQTLSLIPPWIPWVPETRDSGLSLNPQLFLAVGLMLHRAPNVVRSRPFAESVQCWVQTELSSPAFKSENAVGNLPPAMISAPAEVLFHEPNRPASVLSMTSLQIEEQTKVSAGILNRPANVLSATSPPQETRVGASLDNDGRSADFEAVSREPRQTGGDEARLNVLDAPSAPVVMASDSIRIFSNQPFGEEHLPFLEIVHSPELPDDKLVNKVAKRETREIETAFGGVFYLVNLGLFLELYGDFTNPLRPGIDLPLWDFVALVGRELVGSQLEDDPVWVLLADLAGRADDEEPGLGFTPSEQLLETLANALLSHPLTLSLSREGKGDLRPAKQEEYEELERHNATLSPWLDRLMSYVRARLQRALGLTEQDDLGAVLCRHRARVMATATHVDVYLSLADLPIAIRLAGLDRDPGWVPAAGRYVAFHFD